MTEFEYFPPHETIAELRAEIDRLTAASEAFRGKLAEQCGQTLVARAEIDRLNRYAERLRANAERDANEIERLTRDLEIWKRNGGDILLRAEIERLQAEVAEWKERWAAERRDHETTIRHFDTLMNETP